MIGNIKDPRDINSQARKEKREEFLKTITIQEIDMMTQAGPPLFNADHTINNDHIDSWMSHKFLESEKKKKKQSNWENWPTARKDYWVKREILTHNEFIYLLKEKEPRSLEIKPTQFDYFPREFCVFHDETVRIIEDFRVMKKITPIYEDTTKPCPKIGFKTIDLIKLALSKNIHVPNWLLPISDNSIEKAPQAIIEQFPFLNREDPFYSSKLHQAFNCWIGLYGNNGSIREKYNKEPDQTLKSDDNYRKAVNNWLGNNSTLTKTAISDIFKVINPNNNPRNSKK